MGSEQAADAQLKVSHFHISIKYSMSRGSDEEDYYSQVVGLVQGLLFSQGWYDKDIPGSVTTHSWTFSCCLGTSLAALSIR